MSKQNPNSPQAKDLIGRLIPKQQIHNHPITFGSTVGRIRPNTRSNNRPLTSMPKKTRLPPLTTSQETISQPQQVENNQEKEEYLETIEDPFEFIEYARKRNLHSEFVYLYPTNIIEDAEHPTRLRIIPANQASREEFWNLSLKGLTHVKGAQVDFISVNDWLRSIGLFKKIMQIPFFKYQRQWRLFRLWRSYVNRDKMQSARSALSRELFFSHTILRPAFILIQRELNKLAQIKLFSIHPDGLYTLEQFTEANAKHRDEVAIAFENFFIRMTQIVQDACEKTLEQLNSPERSPNVSNESPLELLIAHYNRTHAHTAIGAPTYADASQNLTFTAKANHRAVCQKLARFIRMIDYVVISSLRSICFMSLLDMFSIIQSLHIRGVTKHNFKPTEPIDDLELPTEYQRLYASIIQKTSDVFDSPIFKVDVTYDNMLIWTPADADVIHRIDVIRNEFIDILFKVPRLLVNPLFRPYLAIDVTVDQFRIDKMSSPDLGQIIFNDPIYKETTKKQNQIIMSAFDLLKHFSKQFEQAIQIYESNMEFDTSFLLSEAITAHDVRKKLKELREQEALLRTITEKSDVGIFSCSMKRLKELLVKSPEQCRKVIKDQIPYITRRILDDFTQIIHKAHTELTQHVDDVASFVSYLQSVEKYTEMQKELQTKSDIIRDFYYLASEQGIFLSADEQNDYQALLPVHEEIKNALAQSADHTTKLMPKFTKMLEQSISQLHEAVKEVTELAANPALANETTSTSEAASILVVIIAKTDEIHELAKNFNTYQKTMLASRTKFDDVQSLVKDVSLKQLAWETKTLWEQITSKWFAMNFKAIDPSTMTDEIKEFKDNAMRAAKGLPNNKAVDEFCSTITDFANLLPVVQDLKNPSLKQSHMDQIESLLGAHIFEAENFTFKKLFDLHAFHFVDQIHHISTQATNEQALIDMLEKVQKIVESLAFNVTQYKNMKNTYLLNGFTEIFEQVDESISIISNIRTSHYVAQLRQRADEWMKLLKSFDQCLHALHKCQALWTFVGSIFVTSDFARSLPDDFKDLSSVDKTWRNISSKANDDPAAFKLCQLNQTLPDTEEAITILERIKKNIERYLESKRMSYPRLYFLSNDELLDLFSQSKDPNAIQPYLPRLFDGINEAEFGMENHVPSVIGIINAEGEKIAVRPIKYRSNIESWLLNIEEITQRSLRNEMKTAKSQYTEMVREDWIQVVNSQIAFAITQIEWDDRIKLAFTSQDILHSLEILLTEIDQGISSLSKISRITDLSYLERTKTQSLIALDLNYRDLVKCLVDDQITDINSIHWYCHLKYQWDDANKDIIIEQANNTFHYGFEFMNCYQRLFITPLTRRCFLTITSALGMKFGSAIAGESGTGKTETFKELSRAMAIYCMIFNCSESITIHQLSSFMRGIIQSGSWICMIDPYRLSEDVMSVLGEHLNSLHLASVAGLKRFDFEGYEIQLNLQCSCFFSISGSQTVKNNIPENLRSNFRPIVMYHPDFFLIVENILLSLGFIGHKRLAHKLVTVLKYTKTMLKSEKHNSFNMRTIKAISNYIISLRQTETNLTEDQVIISALKSVVEKMLNKSDATIFKTIINDAFNGLELPDNTDPAFIETVTSSCRALGLQTNGYIVEKAAQLHEALGMHTGVMIIGNCYTGKSTLISLLEHAYNSLSDISEDYFPIVKTIICPNTMETDELYGRLNMDNLDWNDGFVSRALVEACSYDPHYEQWIVFDGAIQASWIENLNSAIDDNRIASFDDARRVRISSQIHILFETHAIHQISPATISRIGIIHMDKNAVSWKYVTKSRFNEIVLPRLGDKKELKEKFEELIELSFYSVMEYIHENAAPNIVPCGCVDSFFKIFDCISDGLNYLTPNGITLLATVFLFSFMWGFGGHFDNSKRIVFDSYIRDTFSNSVPLPSRGIVFDWFLDLRTAEWTPWSERVPRFIDTADDEFEMDPNDIKFHKVLVPTVETVRMKYILNLLIKKQQNIIVRGPIGSGKTLIIRTLMREIMNDGITISMPIICSPITTAKTLQKYLKMYLEKKPGQIVQPIGGHPGILYVYNANAPDIDSNDNRTAPETLRQLVAYKGYRQSPNFDCYKVQNCLLLAVCLPDGGDVHPLPPRLVRHAINLEITPPDSSSLFLIVHSIWQLFFRNYGDQILGLIPKLANQTIFFHDLVQQTFTPTIDKPHYLFNTHDLARLIQSLLHATPAVITSPASLERMWVHEVFRTYADRINNESDKKKIEDLISQVLKKKLNSEQLVSQVFAVHFGNFSQRGNTGEGNTKVYREYENTEALKPIFEEALSDYHCNKRGQTDSLILFDHIIPYISRMVRVLRKQRGHMTIIGGKGIGKKATAKFACFMTECDVFDIDGSFSFHDEIKTILMRCGINGKDTAIIISGTKLADPQASEDIASLVLAVDTTCFFTNDDLEKISNDLVFYAKSSGENESHQNLLQLFNDRVLEHLHIIISLSQDDKNFKNLLHKYPSLIYKTCVIYFEPWPASSFINYAKEEFTKITQDESYTNKLADLSYLLYQTVEENVVLMSEFGEHSYSVIPALFIRFVQTYKNQISTRIEQNNQKIEQLLTGIDKLRGTTSNADEFKRELSQLEKHLSHKEKEFTKISTKIDTNQQKSDSLNDAIKTDVETAQKQMSEADELSKNTSKEFEIVFPMLNKSIAQMKSLQRTDINELRSLTEPPPEVKIVMEIVCLLMNQDPIWKNSVAILSDPLFATKVTTKYNEDFHVPIPVLEKIRSKMQTPAYEQASRPTSSLATRTLFNWTKALVNYEIVFRKVEPQQQLLSDQNQNLKQARNKLKINQTMMQNIDDELEELKQRKDNLSREIRKFNDAINETKTKISQYEKLEKQITDDKQRWSNQVNELKNALIFIPGDTFLICMYIIYFGPFYPEYRDKIFKIMKEKCVEADLLISPTFRFTSLIDDGILKEWISLGLSEDQSSIENAILMHGSHGSPFIIDPYSQASKFIKNLEQKDHQLQIIKPNAPNFLRTIETYVRGGMSVLIEDVKEKIDPALDFLISKRTFQQDGKAFVKIGERTVEIDEKFRMIMSTRINNPKLPTDIYYKTTVINFKPTLDTIQTQLLTTIFNHENPEDGKKLQELATQILTYKKTLAQIETRTLDLLRLNGSVILEDQILAESLISTKEQFDKTQTELEEAQTKETEILAKKAEFKVVAHRVALIFEATQLMKQFNQLYQFPIEVYRKNVVSILNQIPEKDENRIQQLIDIITFHLVYRIGDSYSGNHRLIFTFFLTALIMISDKKLTRNDLKSLIVPPQIEASPFENPFPELVNNDKWNEFHSYSRSVNQLRSLPSKIISDVDNFKDFLTGKHMELPDNFKKGLSDFHILLVYKVLAPERISPKIKNFIQNNLGLPYLKMSSSPLEVVFPRTVPVRPILLIHTSGDDPRNDVLNLARNHQMNTRLITKAIGQDSANKVETLIHEALQRGDWLLLQNLHMSHEVAKEIEGVVMKFSNSTAHPNFRLFLTTSTYSQLPVDLLRKSIKVNRENNQNMRSFMINLLEIVDKEYYGRQNWTMLVYLVAFFHTFITFREILGSTLGFHFRTSFKAEDFKSVLILIKPEMTEFEIKWDRIKMILNEMTYGTHFIGQADLKVFQIFIDRFFNQETLKPGFVLTSDPFYKMPESDQKSAFLSALENYPDKDSPSIFGISTNVNDIATRFESHEFLRMIQSIQAAEERPTSNTAETMTKLIRDIQAKIPVLDDISAKDEDVATFSDPLTSDLKMESDFLKHCLKTVSSTLHEIEKIIRGQSLLTNVAASQLKNLQSGVIPNEWHFYTAPSHIFPWLSDLSHRVDFFNSWVRRGKPASFALNAFTNPAAFLQIVLQRHSRIHKVPLEKLSFSAEIYDQEPQAQPENGVFIHGMLCRGFKWNKVQRIIEPIEEGKGIESPSPYILLLPVIVEEKAENHELHSTESNETIEVPAEEDKKDEQQTENLMFFNCPLYTSIPKPSKNFNPSLISTEYDYLCHIPLPTLEPEEAWIERGASLSLSSDCML